MKNKTLLNGFYAGALFYIWKMIVLALGKQHDWLPTFPAAPLLLLTAVFIFISITRYTEKNSSFPDDFKAGARTGLIAGLTAGIFVYVYYAWFDPEFMPIRIQETLELMKQRDPGISAESLAKNEEEMQRFFSPFFYSILTLSGTSFFGMAFALIVAGLKRAFKVV